MDRAVIHWPKQINVEIFPIMIQNIWSGLQLEYTENILLEGFGWVKCLIGLESFW